MDGPPPPEETPPPMEQALVSDNWKFRKFGYEELENRLKAASPKDPIFAQYVDKLTEYSKDGNASAQDAAVSLVYTFIVQMEPREGGGILAEHVGPLVNSLVDKSFGSRPGTKRKAMDAVIELGGVGLGSQGLDVVIRKGFNHKVAKVVQPSVEVCTEALKMYGPRVFAPPPIIKAMIPMFEHKDGKIRKAAMECIGEMYRWMGPTIQSILPELRDAQMTEIKALFEKTEHGNAKPEKFPRYMDANAVQAASSAGGGKGGKGAADAALEFVDPVNVLGQLGKEFNSNLGDEQWKKRKEALDFLLNILKAPKLVDADYSDLVRKMRALFNDSNVVVTGTAIQILGRLGEVLRGDFTRHAYSLLNPLVDLWKDKRIQINKPVTEALDIFAKHCFSMGDERFCAEMDKGFKHKVAKVKLDCLQYIIRTMPTQEDATIRLFSDQLSATFVKMLDDAEAQARSLSATILAMILARTSDQFMARYLDGLDPKKLKMITSSDVPLAPGAAPPAASSAAPTPAASSAPAPAATSAAAAKPQAAAAKADDKAKPKPGAAAAKKPAGGDDTMSKDEAGIKMEAMFGEAWTKVSSAAWAERLEGMEQIYEQINTGKVVDETGEAVLASMGEKLKDANFKVLGKVLETCGAAALKAPRPNKAAALALVIPIIDKMADLKVKKPAGVALSDFVEAFGSKALEARVHKHASEHKSPKVFEEVLLWVGEAMQQFGPKHITLKPAVEFAKLGLANANPKVRAAGVNLLAIAKSYVGGQLDGMLSDIKDTFQEQIATQLATLGAPPAPTRAPKSATPAAAPAPGAAAKPGAPSAAAGKAPTAAASTGAAAPAPAAFDPSELFERQDISGEMTPQLMAQLKDTNWQKRQAALDQIEQTIMQANKYIQPSLGNLLQGLKSCFGDANKNIVEKAVNIVALLFEAAGSPHAIKFGRSILPDLAPMIGDKKLQIRMAVVNAFSKCLDHSSHREMVIYVSKAMEVKNQEGRVSILTFVSERFADVVDVDLAPFADPLVSCLSDKNSDVRKAAEDVLAIVVRSIGTTKFRNVCSRQSVVNAVMATINAMLDKIGDTGGASSMAPAAAAPPTPTPVPVTPSQYTPPIAPTPAPVTQPPAIAETPEKRSVTSRSSISAKSAPPPPTPPSSALFLSSITEKQKRIQRARQGWNYTGEEVSETQVQDLQILMEGVVHPELLNSMFTKDFRKTSDALQAMTNDFLGESGGSGKDYVLGSLDVIMKYAALQLMSQNTTVVVSNLSTILALFELLQSVGYQLSDYEAHCFFPFLVNKLGNNKDSVRATMREVVSVSTQVYPASLVFGYLVAALGSRNSKNRFECVDACAELITKEGMAVVSPITQITTIAKQVGDNAVRPAVLKCLVAVYSRMPEDRFLRLIAPIKGKERTFIDEKLKRFTPLQGDSAYEEAPLDNDNDVVNRSVSQSDARTQASWTSDSRSAQNVPTEAVRVNPVGGHGEVAVSRDLVSTRSYASHSSVGMDGGLAELTRGLSPQQQAEAIFQKLEDQIPSEDMVLYLRHLGSLLSNPQYQHYFTAENQMDQMVERLMSHLQAGFAQDPFDARLCKYLIFTLMTIMEGQLAKSLTVDVVTVVMHELIMLTILYSQDKSDQMLLLVRAINATVVSFTDNANPTVTLCFMIRLLHSPPMDEEYASDAQLLSRYNNITTRMMVKLVKKLPELMPVLDLEQILIEIDHFLFLYSSGTQNEVLDLPNRIVKTIVHSIVKYKGPETRTLLRNIAPPSGEEDSTLVHLVNILLQQQQQPNPPPPQQQQQQQQHQQQQSFNHQPAPAREVPVEDARVSHTTSYASGHSDTADSMDRLRDLRARVKAQSQMLHSQTSSTAPVSVGPGNSSTAATAAPMLGGGSVATQSLRQLRDKLKNAGNQDPVPPSPNASSSIVELKQRLGKLKGAPSPRGNK